MKKILLFVTLFATTLGWSQYEIISIDRDNDNFCAWDFKSYTIKVIHPGFSAPSIVTTATSTNQGLLDITYNNSLAYTDTIEFFVDVFDGQSWVALDGVEDDSLEFSFLTAVGAPIPSLDTIVEVTVNGEVSIPNVDLSSVTICSNGQPLDLDLYATPSGGAFDWGVEQSNIFNPVSFYNENGLSGMGFYEVTNVNGCASSTEFSINLNMSPIVTPSTNPSNCGSAIGDATVNITPGTASGMMEVYWSNGFLDASVSSTSMISNLSSGVYYANVTDADGCKAVGTAQVGDVDVVITDVITSETCLGLNNGTIDLTITAGGNVTQTFWSNGVTTEDMTGHAGEYTVEIHTDNNCNAYGTYIIPENNLWFSLVSPPNPVDCFSPGNSFVDIDTGSTAGINSLVWEDALGTIVATTADFNPLSAGVFTCTLTDNNGCTKSWDLTIESTASVGANVASVTQEDCGMSNGAIDINVFWGPVNSFLWSNGESTEDLSNLSAGDYTLEYTDASGCANYLTVTVPNARPYQPQICLLTVDTSLVYNEVVWEKDPNNIVDGYNIYRETSNYGVFELVTSLPYSHESAYIDNAASPVDRSWRYFITSYDACSESYGSFIHKTIHIVVTANNGTDVDLAWDDYEGITYSSIDLMRFDETNGWQLVANLPIGTNSYTDTPPVFLGLDYMVSFNLTSPCTSTKAQDHNASRSNTSSSTFTGGDPTDLSVIEKEDGKIILYPNPTSDNLNIYIENADDYDVIRIVNVNGELVYEQTISESLNSISTADFAKGIYFVQIYSDNGIVTEKIIKQ